MKFSPIVIFPFKWLIKERINPCFQTIQVVIFKLRFFVKKTCKMLFEINGDSVPGFARALSRALVTCNIYKPRCIGIFPECLKKILTQIKCVFLMANVIILSVKQHIYIILCISVKPAPRKCLKSLFFLSSST